MAWDSNTARWMGIGHGLGFVSSDSNAAPGTWFGYHNGAYDQPQPDTIPLYNSGDPNLFVRYSQLMDPTDVTIGQDTWFAYQQRPSTRGRFRDMVVRALHFD